MKIGIIGYYGHNNLGDELNLYYIIKNLEHRFPRAEITVFSGALAQAIGAVPYNLVLADNLGKTDYIKALNQQDVLILGGGGLIFLGAYYWDFMDEGVTSPYIICRMGIDNTITSPEVIARYQKLFDKASEVSVRTSGDQNLFQKYFYGSVEKIPEPIWQHYVEAETRNIMAINLTPHCNDFVKELNTRLEKVKIDLELLACQYTHGMDHDDVSVLKKLDIPACHQFSLSIEERARSLQSARFVIAARLHGCQCAIRALRPTIAIAYRPKVHFLMEQVGLAEFALNIDQVLPQLPDRLEKLFSKEQ